MNDDTPKEVIEFMDKLINLMNEYKVNVLYPESYIEDNGNVNNFICIDFGEKFGEYEFMSIRRYESNGVSES